MGASPHVPPGAQLTVGEQLQGARQFGPRVPVPGSRERTAAETAGRVHVPGDERGGPGPQQHPRLPLPGGPRHDPPQRDPPHPGALPEGRGHADPVVEGGIRQARTTAVLDRLPVPRRVPQRPGRLRRAEERFEGGRLCAEAGRQQQGFTGIRHRTVAQRQQAPDQSGAPPYGIKAR